MSSPADISAPLTGLSISPSSSFLLSTSPSGVSLAKPTPAPPRPSTTPIKGQMSRRLSELSDSLDGARQASPSLKQPKPTPASKSVQALVNHFELRASPSKEDGKSGLKRSVSGLSVNGDLKKGPTSPSVEAFSPSSPSPKSAGLPPAPLVPEQPESSSPNPPKSELEVAPSQPNEEPKTEEAKEESAPSEPQPSEEKPSAEPSTPTPTTSTPQAPVDPTESEASVPSDPTPLTTTAESAPTNPEGPHALNTAFCLFFQDTSPTKKASSTAEDTHNAYSHGQKLIFTAKTVEEFCGSWKALRGYVKQVVGSEDGLAGLRNDSNFNFFREGVKPMWEDPMNSKGGRLTVPCQKGQIDAIYTQIVLLLVGSVVEVDSEATSQSGGMICGAVASRRSRGDRIEIWLGGETAPDQNWISRVKDVLANELDMPEIRDMRYRKHFS